MERVDSILQRVLANIGDGETLERPLLQRQVADSLKAQGFEIEGHGALIKAVKGNDRRLIYPDGVQRRALGAKR
jgi:hypothetical protein